MSREESKVAEKSREIGRQLTQDSRTSQNVLVQVLENVGKAGQDGYFTIHVDGKDILARQLG
ncbi:MAG: hypothetical protein AAGA66_01755 [Bacteroidota bacterium]